MGPLIHQQDGAAALPGLLQSAAEIPLRRAAIAMKQQLHRRARRPGIKLSMEPEPIPGGDPDILIGNGPRRADHLGRDLPEGGILRGVRQKKQIGLPLLRHGKGHAVTETGACKGQKKQRRSAVPEHAEPSLSLFLPSPALGRK